MSRYFPIVYWWMAFSWLVAILITNPSGNFPLNDDWAYAEMVLNWRATGSLSFNGWQAMTLIGQVVWGYVFCSLFGDNHTVLRYATLVLSTAGLWIFFRWLRIAGSTAYMAAAGTMLLAFSPWYFFLSFSFMTDVPFLACFVSALYAYHRAFKSRRATDLAVAILLSIAATLIRQFGLLAPLIFFLAVALDRRSGWQHLLAADAIVLTYLAMRGYLYWQNQQAALPEAFGSISLLVERALSPDWLTGVPRRLGACWFYWGLFLLPLTCWNGKEWLKARPLSWITALLLIAPTIPYSWEHLPEGNIFHYLGLGPKLLKDGYFTAQDFLPNPPLGLHILRGIGFAGGILLLTALMERILSRSLDPFHKALLLGGLLYTGYLMIDYYFWDRYLILPLPLFILALLPRKKPGLTADRTGWLLLILMALFSIAATHDYLNWNRTRWKAINQLEQQGFDATLVDGGFEFNANTNRTYRNPITPYGKSWWYVVKDSLAISFSPLPCYQPVKTYAYSRWLPPGKDTIYLNARPPHRHSRIFHTDTETTGPVGKKLRSNPPGITFEGGRQRDSSRARSGRYALRLDSRQPFGFGRTFKNAGPCTIIEITAWRAADATYGGLAIVGPTDDIFYQFHAGAIEREKSGNWQKLNLQIQLPSDYPAETVKVYYWNHLDRPTWVDDWTVRLFSPAAEQ